MLGWKKKPRSALVTMDDVPLDGRTVLVRVDYNVSVSSEGKVGDEDDYRIEASLETLAELRQRRCKVILLTHLGDPLQSRSDANLEPVKNRLEDLIHEEVRLLEALTGDSVLAVVDSMEKGSIVMLPNVRLDEREVSGSDKLAAELAGLAEVYINEAFSVCHRDHTSVSRLSRLLPAAAGRRTVLEYEVLAKLSKKPKRPYVAIVSGAKVHTKINLLRALLNKVDALCVGGVLANMFLANQGKAPRGSFTYEDMSLARELWEEASDKIIIPKDVVIGSINGDAGGREVVTIDTALASAVGVWDVGPETISEFLRRCEKAETIMWNGPVGKFEVPSYAEGTTSLAEGLASIDAYRIVGGGDTARVLDILGLRDKFDHVSVGGGAMVAMLEGSPMPGLEPLLRK